jgi:integrase
MPLQLKRRARSPYWYVRGTFHGTRVNESTQSTDKTVAQRYLRALESDLARGVQRDAITFRQGTALYLKAHPRALPDERAIQALCDHLIDRVTRFGELALPAIKPYMVTAAALALYPDRAASTLNRMVIMNAGAIINYCAEQDLCPPIKLKRLKEREVEPRDVDAGVARALEAAVEGRQQLLLLMLFRQGWRIGELLTIKWPQLDLAEAVILHHNHKGDAWNKVPLHEDVAAALALIPEAERVGKLFPWNNRWDVYRWLKPLAKRLGTTFTPHQARHTFATRRTNDGATAHDLVLTGNWADLKSVKRYTRVDIERARSVINRVK